MWIDSGPVVKSSLDRFRSKCASEIHSLRTLAAYTPKVITIKFNRRAPKIDAQSTNLFDRVAKCRVQHVRKWVQNFSIILHVLAALPERFERSYDESLEKVQRTCRKCFQDSKKNNLTNTWCVIASNDFRQKKVSLFVPKGLLSSS